MIDSTIHKVFLSKVLLALIKDKTIGPLLGFKGGTCAMFFYGLPRVSVDLDFDFLGKDIKPHIPKIKKTIEQFGKIDDFNDKFHTLFFELNYGFQERNMKIEIRKETANGKYITQNFMGESIFIMDESDLFTNKLIALLNRNKITNRDIFDTRFFLQKGVPINENILITTLHKTKREYLQNIKTFIQNYDFQKILYGLGELLDNKQKDFAKTKMKDQIIGFLELY